MAGMDLVGRLRNALRRERRSPEERARRAEERRAAEAEMRAHIERAYAELDHTQPGDRPSRFVR